MNLNIFPWTSLKPEVICVFQLHTQEERKRPKTFSWHDPHWSPFNVLRSLVTRIVLSYWGNKPSVPIIRGTLSAQTITEMALMFGRKYLYARNQICSSNFENVIRNCLWLLTHLNIKKAPSHNSPARAPCNLWICLMCFHFPILPFWPFAKSICFQRHFQTSIMATIVLWRSLKFTQ